MTTLADNALRAIEIGVINDLPVVASDIIYQGAAVGISSGNARPLVAGDPFAGFAQAKADNASGSAGDIKVSVIQRGRIELAVTGVTAVTDIGKPVYASDDNTFTLTASTSTMIGKIVRHVASTKAIVEFDGVGVAHLTALTEAGGAIGGTSNGDLPDLDATAATVTGTLTGTTDGVLADVQDIALSTTDTYTDLAVNTAVNAAILEANLQLKELQEALNEVVADNVALRAAIRENATMINSLIARQK